MLERLPPRVIPGRARNRIGNLATPCLIAVYLFECRNFFDHLRVNAAMLDTMKLLESRSAAIRRRSASSLPAVRNLLRNGYPVNFPHRHAQSLQYFGSASGSGKPDLRKETSKSPKRSVDGTRPLSAKTQGAMSRPRAESVAAWEFRLHARIRNPEGGTLAAVFASGFGSCPFPQAFQEIL